MDEDMMYDDMAQAQEDWDEMVDAVSNMGDYSWLSSGDAKMSKKKPSFELYEINTADNEIVMVVRGGFTQALSDALLAYRQPWDGKFNPAIASMGQFVRDAGHILRGEPVERFPFIARLGVVEEASAYEDEEVENTSDVIFG